jgi:signal transduction histidine kinase
MATLRTVAAADDDAITDPVVSAMWVVMSEMLLRRSLERTRIGIDHVDASKETEQAVEEILGELALLLEADRAYIIEESEDRTTAAITHEWCCQGVVPIADRLGEMPSDAFPWLRRQLAQADMVYVPSLQHLPHEASVERDELSRRNAGSMIAAMLEFGHRGFGMVAFEWASPREEQPADPREMLVVRALLSSALHERRSLTALQSTNRVLEAMVECSDALLRAEDELALLEEVCRIIVEVGGYRLAWVGLGERDERRSVTPVAKWGYDENYLDEVQVTWGEIDLGNGPVSRAVRTGRPAAVQSVATDPDFAPWREAALARGYRSVLAVSLNSGDGMLGALGVYSERSQAFDDLEVEMMQRFADYLSYGIVALRTRASREQAEEQLRQTLRSKDELVASISHELRTPLTAVVGFAQILQESADLPEEDRAAMVSAIVEQGLDVTNILEDLLTVAKAESGTLSVVRVPVDLRAEAAQVVESLDRDAASSVDLQGPSHEAMADPGRVRQILRNLLSNALRYGGDEVHVWIVDGVRPMIRVLDNGAGIPEEDRERIFESYQKAHDNPGLAGSIGLGLAISRTLARLMNGDLTYTYEGGMSIFELSFTS